MTHRLPRRATHRGSALLLAIVFLATLFLLARAFQVLIPSELNSALRLKMEAAASLAADAGIQDTMAWIEWDLGANPTNTYTEPTTSSTPSAVRTGTLGDWQWSVTVQPDDETAPRGNNPVHAYKLTSQATYGGKVFRTVSTWVTQSSFAKFGFFDDVYDTSTFTTVGSDHYDGPVFLNQWNHMWVPSGSYAATANPVYTGTVTTAARYSNSADGVLYDGPDGAPYDSNGNPIPGRYEHIYSGGRASLTTGAKSIVMPSGSQMLARNAWGGNGSPPDAAGVYVHATGGKVDGGVYVQGTVDKMVLGVDGAGNRTVTITQGGTQTVVTETTKAPGTAPNGRPVALNSTLVVSSDGQSRVHNGLTNGAIFAKGNINSLSGKTQGRRTVGVDIATGNSITIAGNLTYDGTTPGSVPASSTDNLGVVANEIHISSSIPRSTSAPLYLYGALMAGKPGGQGGFFVDQYYDSSLGVGTMNMYGGLIISNGDVTGTMGWGSGQLFAGFNQILKYDANLATSPPPFFPTLPKLTMRSWSEAAVVH